MQYTATYSPDDNKLRLSATQRLNAETYARVKAAGFKWAPKQEQFIAPMWTPARADLCIELAGEIDDEDTTLLGRAEDRAERFDEYGENRMADYERANRAADEYTKPFRDGQPILIGHHSEKKARRAQKLAHAAMDRVVKAWDTAKYWEDRAAAAIAHAKYKERPDVRARRIKTIEADLRKVEREKAKSLAKAKLWEKVGNHEQAYALACGESGFLKVANKADGGYFGWSAYDVLRPAEERYRDCPAMTWEEVKAVALRVYNNHGSADRWIEHYELRLAYERAMLAESGYVAPPKKVGRAALPLLNYGGEVSYKRFSRDTTEHAIGITKAEFAKIPNDYKGTALAVDGTHRVRIAIAHAIPGAVAENDWNARHAFRALYLTDAKQNTKPGTTALETREQQETQARIEKAQQKIETNVAARKAAREHNAALVQKTTIKHAEAPAEVDAMRDALKTGVKIVVADQLFPTPPEVAARMVALADIGPGDTVLEPSAGTGNILRAIVGAELNPQRAGKAARVHAIEVSQALANGINKADAETVTCADFLCCEPGCYVSRLHGDPIQIGQFDAIVMNPPFADAADIKHIEHAIKFLEPGGRLVAICANGPRQNAKLKPMAASWEELPAGTFAGTNVRAAIMTYTAPRARVVSVEEFDQIAADCQALAKEAA